MVGTRRSKRQGAAASKKEEQRTITDFFSKRSGPSSLSSTPSKPLASQPSSPPEQASPPPVKRLLNYNLRPVHGVRALDSCSLDLTALADYHPANTTTAPSPNNNTTPTAADADAKRKLLLAADIIDVDALPDIPPDDDTDIDVETERVHQQFMNLDTSLDGSNTMATKHKKPTSRSSKVSKRRSPKKPRSSTTIAKTEDEEIRIVPATPTPRRRSPPVAVKSGSTYSRVTRKSSRRKRRSKLEDDGDAVMTDGQSKSNQVIDLCDSDCDTVQTKDEKSNSSSSSSSRISTSPPPNKLSKTEPEEPTGSVRNAVDSDGDNRMEDKDGECEPIKEEKEPKRGSGKIIPAASRPENESDDESSDEEEFLRQLAQDKRRSDRLKASLGRSSDINASIDMQTANISTSSISSVFGTTNYRKEAAQTTRKMAQVLKERNRRDALEKENRELREDIFANDKKEMDAEEKMIKAMADAEQRSAEEQKRLHEKYHAAVALFISKPSFPDKLRKDTRNLWIVPKDKGGREKQQHQLARLLRKAHENGTNCGRIFLKAMDLSCVSSRLNPPKEVAHMLFDRVVFDESFVNHDGPTTCTRDIEYEALLIMISYSTKELPLPSMKSVLESYGVACNPRRKSAVIAEIADTGSFDRNMMREGVMDRMSERGMRNLTRAFAIWTRQVESEMELASILGHSIEKDSRKGFSHTAVYSFALLEYCFYIMLSPFGARLAPELEQLFDALLDRVEEDEWNRFRQQCAREALQYTAGRLGLIADLVIYLMSVRTERSRALGLDISYLALWCWHKGPTDNPEFSSHIMDSFRWPVLNPTHAGGISYKFGDIVNIVAGIPELTKESEVAWALVLARVLNHATIHHAVLDTRRKGEYLRLANIVKKMRFQSHRMEFGVAQKKFQFALDALITASQGFIGKAVALKELHPDVKEGAKQSKLAFGMARK